LLAGTRLLVPTHRVSDENLVEQFDGPRLYQQVDAGPLVHRVRRGETGASIARRYGLTLAELRAMNRRVSPLKPGMTLTVRRSQKQTVLVAEDGSRKVISRQATVPATATASSGSHTAIRLVHYSPARTQTAGSSNTAASRSTASRLDSRVTLRSDRSATRHTLRQSGKTTVALADTPSRTRSTATASTSTRSTTTRKSASTTTSTGKRLKAASASSATSRGSASSRSASTKAASAKSASSRKAVNSTNTRASSRSTATRTKAGSSRPRASHKVADAR
ncbi:MAG: LysM peptidoglycan-binding domain-containing protein, partial [Lautropia mirabilis]